MNRILIVDDDSIIRDVTARILASEGFHVDQVASLREARERIMQTEYALMLTDMNMPDGNGISSIAPFKELRPQLDIVVMTGYGTLDSVIDSMRAGATDFLLKPCTSQQLRDTVKKVIAKRELTRENKLLRALNEMKDKFLTLVSHELRTPLTLIYGYLSIFQRQGPVLNRDHQELLNIVMNSTRKLINIVNNIQIITQAEAGEMRLHLQVVFPHKLVSEVVTEIKTTVLNRNLNIYCKENPGVGPINADSIRLRQALMELIQNSIRNTPDGGEICAGVHQDGQRVIFWVKDTGIGIPVAEQGKIFEAFYEVADVEQHTSSNSKFQGGGIGLGLALVKAVVEAHQGTIRLETAPNKGTLFEISLPMDLHAQPDSFPAKVVFEPPQPSVSGTQTPHHH